MKSVGIKTVVICGLTIAATFLGGCQGKANKEKAQTNASDTTVVKVVVAEVKESPFEDWGNFSADLRGIEDANLIAPYQGGRVNSIKAVGTRFKAGQSLCDIDGEKYEAALEAARAQVEVARGDLERAKVNVEKGSLGRSVIDATNLAYQNARMVLISAQRAYQDSKCQAPFDGVLVSTMIDKYQTLAPGVPTVRISKLDRLEGIISLSEGEAFSYKEGMRTEFTLLQTPGKIFEGKLKTIDKAVDTRSRTVNARIELINRDGALRPGMVGRARILRNVYSKAIVVPTTALLRLQNGVSAMVVENGIAKQRNVKVAVTAENCAMIAEGLKAGDLLVVSGAFQVSNGTRVKY